MKGFARGVNLAGAEFGESVIPGVLGTHFTYNSEPTFRYFAGAGLWLIRLPLLWERLQPVLGGPLDSLHLSLLKQDLDWARTYGARVIPVIQNFGRYQGFILDNRYEGVVKVARDDLADVWVRLSNEFRDDPAVYAYDLMNEPHDLGPADWKGISQAVLTAIRNNGDNKKIMVPGDNWSAAPTWARVHGPANWIADPADNFCYEAHLYFDRDRSGTYKGTYEEERATPDVGQERLAPFVAWCLDNGVHGYLGEYGVPDNDPRWLLVLDNLLRDLDDAGFDGTYWAAGEWWGSYPLSVQPAANGAARPQAAILAAHLGDPTPLTTISLAGVWMPALAPDSLATSFGSGLAAADAVELTDSTGASHAATILFVSASQINFHIPPEVALGRADLSVRSGGVAVAHGPLELRNVAPSLFDAAIITPASSGAPSDSLTVTLHGTGLRRAATLSLQIGGIDLPVTLAGAQPHTPGLDQFNAGIPGALAAEGVAQAVLIADEQRSNPVTLEFGQH